jgi:hypothetical protein
MDKVCNRCRHLNRAEMTCPAFPGMIPLPFLSGDLEHEVVHPDQTGDTVWEPIPSRGQNVETSQPN